MKNYCLQTQAYLKVCLGLIFVFLFTNLKAQTNLITNFSFEYYIICPILFDPPPSPWYEPSNRPGVGYNNVCSKDIYSSVPKNFNGGGTYQYPRTGNAYIGIFYVNGNDSRNYCQIKLKNSLKSGKRYYAEHYVNLADASIYGCNNIGMLFTKTAKYVDTVNFPYGVMAANPQILNYGNPVIIDTQNWVKVSGIFKATGGEQYLTLGNFKYDSQTTQIQFQPNGYPGSGYNIDDVSVYELDSFNLKADAGKDTTITIGDSIFIGSYTNGIDSLKWLQGTTVIDSTRPGFWVHPLTNTCYVLTQTVNGYTSSDTVCVTVKPLPLKFISYNVISTKEKSVENIWTTATEVNVRHYNITKSIDGRNFMTIGKVKANNKSSNEYSFIDEQSFAGVNYYRIVGVDNDGKMNYSQVRQITLNNVATLQRLNVYPNPARDIVNISCVGMKEVNIINGLGQVIKQLKVKTNMLKIDVSTMPKGLYLLKIINTKNIVYNEKFILQ